MENIATPAKRLGAYIVDFIIMMILNLVVGGIGAFIDPSGMLGALLTFVAWIGIMVYFWSRGTTPGKMALGMRVVKKESGETAGFGTMFLREVIGKFISGIFFLLGYLWILFDKEKQGWHDKLVATVVVNNQ